MKSVVSRTNMVKDKSIGKLSLPLECSRKQLKNTNLMKFSPTIHRSTFTSTQRTKMDRRDIDEYEYDRERRLLTFLKLDGRQYKDQRKILDSKIGHLEATHKQIDEDKAKLLSKITTFNPLDIENLKRYLDHTTSYTVGL